MQVLISAFACLPGRGSEPGVGWEWPKALTEISDHDVTVLTQAINRSTIDDFVAANPSLRVRFRYISLGNPFRRFGTPGHYLFYYIWQIYALFQILKTGEWRRYDLIHHLTYGGIRAGSLLCLLPRPFAFGPVGGAETAPFRLYRGLGVSVIVKEIVRSASNLFSYIDPVLIMMQLRARRVLVRTPETRRLLLFAADRAQVINDVGVGREVEARPRCDPSAGEELRLLFAGRLLYWKGVGYLIRALRQLDTDGIALRVDIAGDGPERAMLAASAAGLRYVDVHFHGRVPQAELFDMYRAAHAFVFPSLHDSGGTAVIEALSFGLPVICFNLGGPPILVGDGGIVLDIVDADLDAAVIMIADAVRTLRDSPERIAALSDRALGRAQALTWRRTVISAFDGLVPLKQEPTA